MGIELLGGGTRRRIDFTCPECWTSNVAWVNKKAESEAERTIHKVVFYCWACNAMLTIEEVEDVQV